MFAQELNNCNTIEKDSDDKMATRHFLLPSGGRCARVSVVGTLTEVSEPSEGFYTGRVIDPTSAFKIKAGKYQIEAAKALVAMPVPCIVSIVGKPDLYEGDDRVSISINAETVTTAQPAARARWVVDTAAQTLRRLKDTSPGAVRAREHYHTDVAFYKGMIIKTLEALQEKGL